ncbi:MAG: orotidine-5'-phosphate decarboxylase [Thermoleophilia bacterium]|nr:orotidine-5'-phosphate decarboxylase [Thermoleophilia bacterium]
MTETGAATFAQRLARRAGDRPFAACAGIDPSPEAVALITTNTIGPARVTRAAAMERFAGMVIEAVRDHAPAVKLQLAWFETAGAPGFRALERVLEFARRADMLVIIDGKRGDVPHSAAAYADAWLGERAESGLGGDALTVNAAVGSDALTAMAEIAAARGTALYALLHTSNPGAAALQAAPLADGRPWWHLLATQLAEADAAVGGGVVGAVIGATQPDALRQARELLPAAPLLVPGIGAQGGAVSDLAALDAPAAPTTLVNSSRSLLPTEPLDTAGFRSVVAANLDAFAVSLA